MDCTKCTLKCCRKSDPCFNRSDEYLENYSLQSVRLYTKADSKLIDNPSLGIPGIKTPEDNFIEDIPSNFNLMKIEEFKLKLEDLISPEDFYLLDLRNYEAFKKDGIPGSINCLLKDLPKQYRKILPDKSKEIIIYCNGGIQSVYGVMFLSIKGYTNVKSLAGGFSKYIQS